MRCAGISGEFSLQFRYFRSEDILAMRKYTGNPGVDFFTKAFLLGSKVDKGDHFRVLMNEIHFL